MERFDLLVVVHAGAAGGDAKALAGLAALDGRIGRWLVCDAGSAPANAAAGVRVFETPAGAPRWAAMQAVLAAEAGGWQGCRHVLFVAGDLDICAAAIEITFELAARHGLVLAQPSLAWHSHFADAVGLHNPSFTLRHVSRLDPAALCVAAPFLGDVLPLLEHDPHGQVIGRVLPRLAADACAGSAVIDAVQAARTAEPAAGPLVREAAALLEAIDGAGDPEFSWGGIDTEGTALSLFDATRDHFLGRLVSGWAQAVPEPAVLGEVFLEHLQRSEFDRPVTAAAASQPAAVPSADPAARLRRSPVLGS